MDTYIQMYIYDLSDWNLTCMQLYSHNFMWKVIILGNCIWNSFNSINWIIPLIRKNIIEINDLGIKSQKFQEKNISYVFNCCRYYICTKSYLIFNFKIPFSFCSVLSVLLFGLILLHFGFIQLIAHFSTHLLDYKN